MQMSVPKINAQAMVSSWTQQDVMPEFVMEPVWVHVEGVPNALRHFLGLWAVGTFIGTTIDVDLYTLRSQGLVRIQVAMRDTSVLEKDKAKHGPPCLEVLARLQLNGYRFRFRRESSEYKPDPRFRPFFWKGEDEDDAAHGDDDGFDDAAAEGAPGASHMDVDGHASLPTSGSASVPVTQVAMTPFNHSPTTDRGKAIVARALSVSPHLVATPPPSRVRTFMQGRTRPVSSSSTPLGGPLVAPTPSSTSPQTERGLQRASSSAVGSSDLGMQRHAAVVVEQ
jgi:hypothetical protein